MSITKKEKTTRIYRESIYRPREIDATWEKTSTPRTDIPWENDFPWDEEYEIEEFDWINNMDWENDAPWDNKRKKSKVAIIPCYSYDQDEVDAAVRKGISEIGGARQFIKKDERILFKPNLLTRAAQNKAVTTHPSVFEAVVRHFKEEGYENLSYGDSPGHPGNIKKTAEVCGISQVAERLDLPMADFATGSTVEYVSGRLVRKYEICKGVLESDAIVNICKMKTHQLETITGAVKNMFGCVHGLSKSASHAKFPDAHSFAQMLIELNLILQPRLHIMDGVIAMEGNGPSSGSPRYMNVLLFSDDPVAMDATFCRLIDLNVKMVPTVYYGEKLYLGNMYEQDIDIVGITNFDDYVRKDFDVVRDGQDESLKWKLIKHLKWISRRPVIDKNKCVKCGVCVKTCPLDDKAVDFPGGRKDRYPEYDYKKCIRCYCCQEMCPEGAITTKLRFGR